MGDPKRLLPWLKGRSHHLPCVVALIILGSGAYGAAIGAWRSPLQSVFVMMKFPLLIFLTTLLNGLANGVIAWLLGLHLSLRQSMTMILMSFALVSVLLGSLAPLVYFFVFNIPDSGSTSARFAHDLLLLVNVVAIAFAGVFGLLRQYQLLYYILKSKIQAAQILFSWFVGNAFLGCQLAWNLRPFFGQPDAPVTFLRENPFDGSFYESVFTIIRGLILK